MAFIPMDKMKTLREAAKNGDSRAQNIIDKHFQKKDYSKDLDDYFNKPEEKPVETTTSLHFTEKKNTNEEKATNLGTGNARLDEFLRGNGISEGDSDYNEAVEDYYREFPNERPATEPKNAENTENVEEELDLTHDMAQNLFDTISQCDKTMLNILQNDDIEATTKKGAMTELQEIKQTIVEALEKIKKVKDSLCKKEKDENEEIL